GVLPLGFGREPRPGPGTERERVVPGDVHDAMVSAAADTRLRPLRPAPRCALDLSPPRCGGDGSRLGEVIGQEAAEDEGPAETVFPRRVARGPRTPAHR